MERLRGNGETSQPPQSNGDFQVNQEIVDLYKAYTTCKDPSSLMDQMAQKIPVIGQIKSGGNMKDRFYNMCKEKGVDPNSIISQLKR